jgi:hypothetical protein
MDEHGRIVVGCKCAGTGSLLSSEPSLAPGSARGRPWPGSSSEDQTVRVWDLNQTIQLRVIRLGVPVSSVTKPANDVVVAGHRAGLTAIRVRHT